MKGEDTEGYNKDKIQITHYLIRNQYLMVFFGLLKEFFVKSADRVELMAMLGYFGAIISACQMYPTFLVF